MFKIAIVEDQEETRESLNRFVRQYAQEQGLQVEISLITDGAEIAEHYTPGFDIIFMDVEMPRLDGFGAAEAIRAVDTDVVLVFVTNMAQYAIRGYEVDALDYVLKPVTYFSFARKLERAISRIPQKTGKPVKVNTPDGVVRIDAGDVYYIESEGHNLIYHTSNGTLKERAKMQDAAGKFEPLGFFRSNKGYLVNLEYVEGVKDGCCTIQGEALLISRARKNDFMTALAQYMGEH